MEKFDKWVSHIPTDLHNELEKFIPNQYNIDMVDGVTMHHEDTIVTNDEKTTKPIYQATTDL